MARPVTRPPEYSRAVGRRLRIARLALGRTQAEMWRELGATDRAWSQWEKGTRLFDVLVAVRLKERFGVPLDWIYAGDPAGLPPRLAGLVRQIEGL